MAVTFQSTEIASPESGVVVDTEQIDAKQVQRVKVVLGVSGADDGDVDTTNPMPVSGPLTDTQLRLSAVPVSGPLTDTQLRATAVPVSGTVTATTGGLTDTQLRAADVKVTLDGEHPSIEQNVVADANNSSVTNLATGNSYTFTGTASSTLGVAGIQVSLFADQNCTVKIEQSPDDTPHWDLIDTYYYAASTNFGLTVQAISSYVRVVVTTNNLTTTTFRLQTALCPIAEPLPRSLDINGRLKVANPMDYLGFRSYNTPMNESRTANAIRLVGAVFEGSAIDSRIWTTAASGTSAAIAQANSQITITSGTSNGATVTMFSTRRATGWMSRFHRLATPSRCRAGCC